MLDMDSTYRYNTSLKVLDSLISTGKGVQDTSFYNGYGKAEVINLDQMIYLTLNNSQDLKAVWYSIDADVLMKKERSVLPDPMFAFELDNVNSDFKKVGMINFFASQTFPFPGKLDIEKQSAVKSRDMMVQEHHNMETELINDVKSKYYDLFLVNRRLDINKENQLLISNFTSASESRYAVGKGMQQEVFKSQIELSKLLNEQVVLEQDRKSILSDLTKFTRVVIDENTKVNFGNIDEVYLLNKDNFNLENVNIDKLVDYAFQNRADLKAVKNKIILNQTELEKSRLSRMPDLSLQLGYRILPFEEKNAFEFMVGVNIPIAPWSSGKYDYSIQRSTVNIKSANEEYEALRTKIRGEIKSTVSSLLSAKETMNYYHSVVIPQTENSLRSTQSSYENNLTTFLDLLDSYRMYQDSKLMYYDSMNMYLKTIAELEKVTGMNFKNQ
jgi:outer membrane protein TolC